MIHWGLELDGEDLRDLPLEPRKGELKALLKRASFGVTLNDYVAGDGPALFAQACAMGLEGIVSKRRSSPPFGPLAALAQGEEPGESRARREALEDWGRKRRWGATSAPSSRYAIHLYSGSGMRRRARRLALRPQADIIAAANYFLLVTHGAQGKQS